MFSGGVYTATMVGLEPAAPVRSADWRDAGLAGPDPGV